MALVGAGRRGGVHGGRLRRIATTGGLAARQRRLTRIAVLHRAGDRCDRRAGRPGDGRGGDPRQLRRRLLQDRRSATRLARVVRSCVFRRPRPQSTLRSSAARARRVQQHGAGAGQRARQRADAARLRRARARRSGARPGSASRCSTRQRIAALKMGLLLGVARGQPGAAAPRRAAPRAERTR